MVPPSWSRQVNSFRRFVELAQESHGDSQGTGTRDRLWDGKLGPSAYTLSIIKVRSQHTLSSTSGLESFPYANSAASLVNDPRPWNVSLLPWYCGRMSSWECPPVNLLFHYSNSILMWCLGPPITLWPSSSLDCTAHTLSECAAVLAKKISERKPTHGDRQVLLVHLGLEQLLLGLLDCWQDIWLSIPITLYLSATSIRGVSEGHQLTYAPRSSACCYDLKRR